ncbi:hypothetical protein SEA_BOILGATE_72 [Mycobacterium phage Boilgate]|nr:hypothetical protein SEA_BOILGATE_72 [Mycobacterium phage Boilgate]
MTTIVSRCPVAGCDQAATAEVWSTDPEKVEAVHRIMCQAVLAHVRDVHLGHADFCPRRYLDQPGGCCCHVQEARMFPAIQPGWRDKAANVLLRWCVRSGGLRRRVLVRVFRWVRPRPPAC